MELTFVTYNIHKGVGNDRFYRLDRILDICRNIDADILALQEVSHDLPRSAYDNIAKIISDELGMHYALGLNVQRRKGAYGNATFSKYPIELEDNLDLTWSIKKNRGCLNSVVRLPGDLNVGVMNFHLGLAGIERRMQIRKILDSDFLSENGHHPTVILGDTNDIYNRLHRYVHHAGFRDASHAAPRFHRRTFPSFAPIWKLDRVYYSRHFDVKEIRVIKEKPARVASDHLPVYVKLKIKDNHLIPAENVA